MIQRESSLYFVYVSDGSCPNPFPTDLDPGKRATPVDLDDITMEEYSKEFTKEVTGDPATAGNYTCLRIKYKLNQYGRYTLLVGVGWGGILI